MKQRVFLGSLVCLLVCSACQQEPGPRKVPFPKFDAKQPFPELNGDDDAGATEAEAEVSRDSYEEAIRAAGGTEGAGETTPVPETTGTQSVGTISLGGILHADIPVEFNEWQYASDGISTLITHQKPGSLPDAIIYIEAFSPATELFPSYESGRFQFTVDPGLSPNIVYPPLVLLGYEWAKDRTAPPLDVLLTLQMATTRTMGMGLGYASMRTSFTGWKWVGETDAGLEVRLGRSSGRWDTPAFPGQRQAEQILRELAQEIPGAGGLISQIEKTRQVASTTRRVPAAAWMVIGSARRKNNPDMGVHIAILCERRPVCAVSEELSGFIGSLRPPQEGANLAASAGPLEPFAEKIGINLLGAEDLISAPQMISLLQQAMNQKKNAAGQPGAPGVPGLPGIPGAGGNGAGTPTTITLPDGSTREITLPPGVELPEGFTLPPGIELPEGGGLPEGVSIPGLPGGAPGGVGAPGPGGPVPIPTEPGGPGAPTPPGATTPAPTEPTPAEPGQPIPIPE